MPTIVSRCVVQLFFLKKHPTSRPTLFPFLVQSNTDPLAFDKELLVSKINERESIELLDDLLTYWVKQYKKNISEKKDNITDKQINAKITKIIHVIKKAFEKPPMPGSGKIFWRNFFLQINS